MRWKGLEEEALLILLPFHRFTYIKAHSPHYSTLPSLHLHHSSLSNPSVASPTSQLVLQPLSLHLHHMHFTYVTWRAAHGLDPPLDPNFRYATALYTSQSTTVTACRVKTEGAKTGLLSAIWSPMTITNESLTLQLLSMRILYPGTNEHSSWGCCIFLWKYTLGVVESPISSMLKYYLCSAVFLSNYSQ